MTNAKLTELLQEFADLDDRDKLDLIVGVAEELPPLSPGRQTTPFPAECRVQECQSAVYLWVDVRDGRVHLEAEAPRNAPVVRGLVTLVLQILNGVTTAEVLETPEDLLPVLGLERALGMTRQAGLRGVMMRIHREVRRQSQAAS